MIIKVLDAGETGKRIKRLMAEKGIKACDAYKAFGFTTTRPIYRWYRGYQMPSLDNLLVLSAVLDMGVDEILVTKTVEWGEKNAEQI